MRKTGIYRGANAAVEDTWRAMLKQGNACSAEACFWTKSSRLKKKIQLARLGTEHRENEGDSLIPKTKGRREKWWRGSSEEIAHLAAGSSGNVSEVHLVWKVWIITPKLLLIAASVFEECENFPVITVFRVLWNLAEKEHFRNEQKWERSNPVGLHMSIHVKSILIV